MRRVTPFAVSIALVLFAAGVASTAATAPTAEIMFERSVKLGETYRRDLYAMGANGSKPRLLVRNADWAAAAPDGRRIAFVRNGAIWVMGREGSGQKQLTKSRGETGSGDADYFPAWSPDSRTIYFSSAQDYVEEWIYAVRPDGTGLRRLSSGTAACQSGPAPSPDGRLIAFTGYYDCEKSRDPYIAAITTAGKRADLHFAIPSSDCMSPSWAPTSKRLSYECSYFDWNTGKEPPGKNGIFVATVGGSRPRQLVRSGYSPTWSPDGATIAFGRGGGIWRVDPSGTGLRRLTRTGLNPAWLPPAR